MVDILLIWKRKGTQEIGKRRHTAQQALGWVAQFPGQAQFVEHVWWRRKRFG